MPTFRFGGGPYTCIGNAFAALEGQLLLVTVAQRCRFELMPDPCIIHNPLITLGMKNGMRMRLVARRSARAEQDATALIQSH